MPKIKTNCFAYDRRARRCTALTQLQCEDGECGFFKTRQQADAALLASAKRRRALGVPLTARDLLMLEEGCQRS